MQRDRLEGMDTGELARLLREAAGRIEGLEKSRNRSKPAYRLLKPMPHLAAGTIFIHDKDDQKLGSFACGCMKLAWDNGNAQVYCGHTYIMPGQLAEDREWFTPIVNYGRYT